jgi:colanic acid/amylovoran biosynthesis protein
MAVRNVCILGASLNTGNMGVSALAASLVKLIKEVQPAAEISFFLGSRTTEPEKLILAGHPVEIGIINYRLSPKAKIREHLATLFLFALLYRVIPVQSWKEAILRSNRRLDALKRADFVGNISGGDSFSDIYGVGRFINGAIVSLIVILLGNRLHMLPQTYGPYKSKISQYLARVIMERSGAILARDQESLEVARRILDRRTAGRTVQFCPDVAFALEAGAPDLKAIYPPLNGKERRNLVGLNVNGLLYNGGYTRNNMFGLALDYRLFVHEMARKLLEQTDCSILLVPHTFAPEGDVESDPQACREVFEAMAEFDGRIHLLQGVHDQHAVKGTIGLCSFFIGSRMHACIAALSQGIPTVAVAYSKKFRGVFDSAGMGHMVIDARETNKDEAEDTILALYRESGSIRQDLSHKVENLKNLLSETFRSILPDERIPGRIAHSVDRN